MKKVIYIMVAFISLALCSCGSNDNTCVKEIVKLIDEGTQQRIATNNGTLEISDIPEGEYFTTPNGNIFANTKILAVIKSNPKDKLTAEDKDMLTKAVKEYFGAFKVETTTVYGATADGLNSAGLEIATESINQAKTLNDLYKIALSKEIV